jgi:serine/threonine protein kinase
VKLIDFGVAKSLSGTIARSCVGTTEIMAPELVSAKQLGQGDFQWVFEWTFCGI